MQWASQDQTADQNWDGATSDFEIAASRTTPTKSTKDNSHMTTQNNHSPDQRALVRDIISRVAIDWVSQVPVKPNYQKLLVSPNTL
jgi:hypothetical protein